MGKSRMWQKSIIISVSLYSTLALLFLARFFYQSPFVSSWDEVDFVLGVEHFDLLLMQPHFPGYPYFILGGMLFNTFLDDPLASLITFNQVMLVSATIPIYFLAKQYVTSWKLALAVVATQSLSYLSLLSTQAMSEAAAIAVLWWFLWSVSYSIQKKNLIIYLLPALLFSILLGIRLSYIPFGVALIFVWIHDWKTYRSALRIVLHGFFAISFQLIWVLALAYSEGGIAPFIELALAFTSGHFQDWGGTAVASESGIFTRLFQLIGNNIFWNGLAGRSVVVAMVYGTLIVLVFYVAGKAIKDKNKPLPISKILLATFCAYFLWALFAQNVEKPRHIVPLLSILALYSSSILLHFSKQKRLQLLSVVIVLLIICGQVINSISVMKQQRFDIPAEYQIANSKLFQPEDKLFTWEETRVLDYLDVNFSHERVLTYTYFLQKKYEHKTGKIYVTNKVVEGFKRQGIVVENYITEVAEFKYSSFIDPIYHTIVIYKWHEGRE